MRQYLNWKVLLLAIAIIIAGISLFEINKMVQEMQLDEQRKIQIHLNALRVLMEEDNEDDGGSNAGFVLASRILTENTSIPIIVTDKNNIITSFSNLDSAKANNNPQFLITKLAEFKEQNGRIVLDDGYNLSYYHYGDSLSLTRLKFYPIILFSIISVFIIILLIALRNAQKSIQNQVWVGMSKETAHQLGTPLTAIVAWMELLKENEANQPYIEEMEKDVRRLQLIADRFSKIGSVPKLKEEDLIERLESMVDYMRKRAPLNVSLHFHHTDPEVVILLIGPLFDWVIENLIRNALDAMEGKGEINITIKNEPRMVTIDLCDTGKGIPKNKFNQIFQPGFSTKMRGWGLGLSLAKRIINDYHNGSIYVQKSEIGKGTTFRIILRR